MRLRPILTAVVTIALLSVVAGSSPGVAAIPGTSSAGRMEVERIQRHFDSVLVELHARDVASLAAEQRSHRFALVETLRAYRDRGLFPRNYDFAEPTPYFIDRRTGVLCAVAHLMDATGRRDLVNRIAARDNNVWVPALAGDRDVGAWLAEQGITLAEAARIQLPYESFEPTPPMRAAAGSARIRYFAGSAAALSASAAAMAMRDGKRGRSVDLLGAAAGLGSIVLAANAPRDGGMTPAVTTVTAANVGVGVAGLLFSVFHMSRSAGQSRQVATPERDERARLSVTPTMSPSEGAGLSVAVRF